MSSDAAPGSARGPRTAETVPVTTGMYSALVALTLMGPLTSDGVLPALPSLATEFDTTADRVQLTITAAMLGVACGQLVLGTLSDAWGRRGLILVGGAGMVLSSVGAATAGSLTGLVVASGCLGLSSAAGLALGRAVLADRLTGPALTRAYSLWGAVVGIAPVLAAVGGAQLLVLLGWRAIFWCFAVMALLTLVLSAVFVPETLPAQRRTRTSWSGFGRALAEVLRSRLFLCASLVLWCGFAAVFAYTSASPFILQTVLGFSPTGFSLVLAADGVGLMLTSALAARLSERVAPTRLLATGLTAASLGAVLAVAAVVLDAVTPVTMVASMLLVGTSMGFVLGPGTALALRDLGHLAGTALAVTGAVQFVFAGLAAPLVGVAGDRSAVPYAVVLVVVVLGSWAGLAGAARCVARGSR